MIREWIARGIVVLGLAAVISIPVIKTVHGSDGIVMHARMAENGGWTPENMTVAVGEPLHLRLTSDDVSHGFAVGQLDQPAVEINPGEMTDITLLFTKPGKYTFYCTRWCSLNHWRMRGSIEVTDPQAKTRACQATPVRHAGVGYRRSPQSRSHTGGEYPLPGVGRFCIAVFRKCIINRDYYLSHTPLDLWTALRSDQADKDLSDQEVWDLVAWVWQSNTTPEQVQAGKELYAANCAACHGEQGRREWSIRRPISCRLNRSDYKPKHG